MSKLMLKLEVELDAAIIEAAFEKRGIVNNKANMERFKRLARQSSTLAVSEDMVQHLCDKALTDTLTLLMYGFSFVD